MKRGQGKTCLPLLSVKFDHHPLGGMNGRSVGEYEQGMESGATSWCSYVYVFQKACWMLTVDSTQFICVDRLKNDKMGIVGKTT